jgi:signal transduction histidine kinase
MRSPEYLLTLLEGASNPMISNEPAPTPSYDQLRTVVWDLHNDAEAKSLALHRTLHDEFGGLIVAAAMDLAAVSSDLPGDDTIGRRLRRAHQAIMSAEDLKRRLCEELRPSLLENIGLFAALRWHTRNGCRQSAATCSEHYPDRELSLTPAALTTLYRIAQESLALVLREPDLKGVEAAAKLENELFEMTLAHEHHASEPVDMFLEAPERMHSLAERTRSLGGEMRVALSGSGTVLIHRFPVDRITSAASR